MIARVKAGIGRRISRLRDRLTSTPVIATPACWHRRIEIAQDDELCLFLTFAPAGRIPDHAVHHARAWADAGFKLILIVVVDDPATFHPADDLAFAAGLLVRRNEGYDFAGWAAAIRDLPALRTAARLAIVNDSVYGPLDNFPAFIARARASPADFVGAIESYEIRHHYQSFLLFFGARALANPAFWRFWRGVRNGSRAAAIDRYETRLLHHMRRARITTEALFPANPGDPLNATMHDWRALIDAGFPFVKTRLIRDNPSDADLTGWRETLAAHGFDPALTDAHLGPGSRA